MQLRIMMLLSDEKNKRLCRCVESILYEVAGSFGHSFSMRYDKIGAASVNEYGAELTEETIDACRKCNGILLDQADVQGVQDLLDELQISLALHYCGVPFGMDSQHGYDQWCGIIRSLDEVTVKEGMDAAFQAAKKQLCTLTHVAPNGKNAEIWRNEISVHSLACPDCIQVSLDAPAVMERLVHRPESIGMLICPPYAGNILRAAAAALCPEPSAMHTLYLGKNNVYASSYHTEQENALSPVALIMALSAMLRFTANLEKEADCVDAAVHNVLQAGWRTPDMPCVNEDQVITPEDMVDLIVEQIALAGQLLHGDGGMMA